MFVIIYQFNIKPKKQTQFINAWKRMTELIYEHENSLGSRLHQKSEACYIAYAQWPDEATFRNSGKKLPKEANDIRAQMRETCLEIETLYELETVEDLLRFETKTAVS
jgi:heme-degrading monooxygenase HmoA